MGYIGVFDMDVWWDLGIYSVILSIILYNISILYIWKNL